MERIYDALKSAEATRLSEEAAKAGGQCVAKIQERRRARRWELDVPLTVYGHLSNGVPFYQEAEAVNGSANGGLIVLRASLREGQDLFLINNWTTQEQICYIVHVRNRDAEISEVGVAFPVPNPSFWQIPDAPCDSEPVRPPENS
jgi:hypothetical protein